jgi:hypothetical protein
MSTQEQLQKVQGDQITPRPLVIYHNHCPSGDGFGAALAAWLKFGDAADYLAADYGDALPDATGRDIFILDLSFPQAVLLTISSVAASLTLLDHHLTGQRSLAGFRPLCCGKIHFDLTKCGAVLAWEHFHPNAPLPKLYRWLQSRDLWTWAEPDSKEFLSWLDQQPKTFEAWSAVLSLSENELSARVGVGAALSAQFDRLCHSILAQAAPVSIGEHCGLMVNCSGDFRSVVGSLLAQESGTFGLVWRVVETGQVACSLRAVEGFDVEGMALMFGGGGHRTSASFMLPPQALFELVQGQLLAP